MAASSGQIPISPQHETNRLLPDDCEAPDSRSQVIPSSTLGRLTLGAAWALCFGCGALSRSSFGHGGGSSGSSAAPGTLAQMEPQPRQQLSRSWESALVQEYSVSSTGDKNWALATSASKAKPEQLWNVVALVHQLGRLTRYPIVLFTDIETFPDGSSVSEKLRLLGVDVRPYKADDAMLGFSKLEAWTLTEFDKVIWIESEGLVSRSLDWLFTREGMWAARADWSCSLDSWKPTSIFMLLEPSDSDHSELVARARDQVANGAADADAVLNAYFSDILLLSELDAYLGWCVSDRIPTPYRNKDGSPVRGAWSMPAYVFQTGNDNVCFGIDLEKQVTTTDDGKKQNICHYHPMAATWRDSFCVAATGMLFLSDEEVTKYCNDACYYKHECDHMPTGLPFSSHSSRAMSRADDRIMEVKQ